jgi:plasmid stabilization system protein ParE
LGRIISAEDLCGVKATGNRTSGTKLLDSGLYPVPLTGKASHVSPGPVFIEFLATLHDAKASLARGEGRTIKQESMRQLATEVKQRGRSRLATEQIQLSLLIAYRRRLKPTSTTFGTTLPRKAPASKQPTTSLIRSRDRFFLLSRHPYLGRSRHEDLGTSLRTFPVGEYLIVYGIEDGDVLILRVVHGRRDLEALFGVT